MADERPSIFIVEDDLSMVRHLVHGLRKAGFTTSLAMDGDEGQARILGETFDLVLLDLMLPGRSGLDVLEAVSTRTSVPIIALTALTDLPARLQSFERGAVDFVPKPFFMEELVARIRARLALTAPAPTRQVELADVTLDIDARRVLRGEADLGLTAHEFNLLAFLVERAGRTVTRAQLAEHALPEDGERTDRTIDSHVSRIRKKLGKPAASCVRTVWGIGYTCDLDRR